MDLVFILLNVILVILIYVFVNFKLKRRNLEKHAAAIPGPMALPLIGSILSFFHIKNVEDMWEIIFDWTNKYDKILKVWLGPKLMIVLSDPTDIEAILSNPAAIEKDAVYKIFLDGSSGIFTQRGENWQALRKPLNKLLHPKLIENSLDIFIKHSDILIEKISGKIGKGPFDFYHVICYCTLDIICGTHGGMDTDEQNGSKYNLPTLLNSGLEILFQRVLKPQFYFDTIFYLTKEGKIIKKQRSEVNSMSKALIVNRLAVLKERENNYNENEKYECYIDVVIDVGKQNGLDVDQMAEWTTDFLVAGFDTTAVTISSAIVFLAMNPEYQEKVYKEQLSIFGDTKSLPTIQDLNAMNYLSMVINETIRHVGVPGIVRQLGSDIKIDNYILPEGSSAFLFFHKMHHDPKYWEYPTKFYPDHFLPENVAKRPKGAFIPFSSGPRGCPGKLYGMLSMKVIFSMLFRRYIFTTNLNEDSIKFKYSLMLEIAGGYQVEVVRRL